MIQCIVVKKIILYAETIDYFFGRVVFLRKDLVEAIGTKKSIHIVVLGFVGHKEHGAVTLFF